MMHYRVVCRSVIRFLERWILTLHYVHVSVQCGFKFMSSCIQLCIIAFGIVLLLHMCSTYVLIGKVHAVYYITILKF